MSSAPKEIRVHQGYAIHILRTSKAEVGVIPELGARIVSLKNRVTGREWMWYPGRSLKLFRNKSGDDFATSTLAGADECIPTIAPCEVQGRRLPDHGEAWSIPWSLDQQAWRKGAIRTTIDLPVSPLRLVRTVALDDAQVRLSYALTNRGPEAEHYLWAFHPLLRIHPGDRLDLPPTTRQFLDGEAWIDDTAIVPEGGCSKLFAGPPVQDRRAAVVNSLTGDALQFRWTGSANNMLGLWLTRGGWNGHHHLAIEPTNGAPDALSEAAKTGRCGTLAPGETSTWEITIDIETYEQKNHRSTADAHPRSRRASLPAGRAKSHA